MGAPDGLGAAGRELWDAVVGVYVLAEHERVLLGSACRHADLLTRLEGLLADGLVTVGSQGQPRISAAVGELRQGRVALSKLLGDLALPIDDAEDGKAGTVTLASPASERARRAALARHDRARRRQLRTAGEA